MEIKQLLRNYPLKVVVPITLLVGGLLVAFLLIFFKPQVQKHVVQPKLPVVTVSRVQAQDTKIPLFSRGTVRPSTEIMLTAEVQGKVVWIAPNFANGATFEANEPLLRIDPVNYRLELSKANSMISKAELNLAAVKADVRINALDKSQIGQARITEAETQLEAAKADKERLQIMLEKTEIRAPFAGRVLERTVGVGQYIGPGMQLGRIFATNRAEVYLPVSDSQLQMINVPYHVSSDKSQNPEVRLRTNFGDKVFYWTGSVIGTTGGVNTRNRLMYLIAHIDDPFGNDPAQPGRPPLTAGRFVEAEIEGLHFDNLFILPREAIRNTNQVLTVDKNQRLHIKQIEVLYKGKNDVYIKSGLADNDFVVLTPMDIVVEGMRVLLSDSQQAELISSSSARSLHENAENISRVQPVDAASQLPKKDKATGLEEAPAPPALPEQ
ncbi:MAG TPA: efflux RND transporter periplasmic adaptor subunit [Pseudomonadales bacterium]|nr:efflux RND transporter periplasmic adaptor subunit [Pseudomonadales bacterium]